MKNIPAGIAANSYGIDDGQLSAVRGGNFGHVYQFEREGKGYVLKLSPPHPDTDLQAQRSNLAWMAYLAVHGASVPAPLPAQNGNLIEVIPAEDGDWLAVAYTQAKGVLSEELPLASWNDRLFRALGKAVGRAHAVAMGYHPPEGASHPEWDRGGNLFHQEIRYEPWLKAKQARVLEQVQRLPKSAGSYGLIHGDLHFANFFVDVETELVTLIDFDDCAYGWYCMDLALMLLDVLVIYPGDDREGFSRRFMRNLLQGYLEEKELAPGWGGQVALFMKLLEINLYEEVARFFPDNAGDWGRRFMPGRQEKIEQDLPYLELDLGSVLEGSGE